MLCVEIYECVYNTYICIDRDMYIYTHVKGLVVYCCFTHTHIHIRTHTHMCTYTQIHKHTCTQTRTQTHTRLIFWYSPCWELSCERKPGVLSWYPFHFTKTGLKIFAHLLTGQGPFWTKPGLFVQCLFVLDPTFNVRLAIWTWMTLIPFQH